MPEANNKNLIFRTQGLTKVYRMGDVEVHALRGVDLELRAGKFVVIQCAMNLPACSTPTSAWAR